MQDHMQAAAVAKEATRQIALGPDMQLKRCRECGGSLPVLL